LYRLAPFKIDDYQVTPLRPGRLAERIRAVAGRRPGAAGPLESNPIPAEPGYSLNH